MSSNAILEKLRQRIDCLEGTAVRCAHIIPVADDVDAWLPQGGLPAGCVHEVKGTSLAAAIAFSAVLAQRVAGEAGRILYISPDRLLHPIGLLPYGVNLHRLMYVSPKRPQDLAWAVLEALRCPHVSAVIAVLSGLDLTESRRLQLAAETSKATGFLLGHIASAPIASAITRWKVSSVRGNPGQRFDEPLWALDLTYCRNGRPGKWIVQWRGQQLQTIETQAPTHNARMALAG
jgi:protein ImuA